MDKEPTLEINNFPLSLTAQYGCEFPCFVWADEYYSKADWAQHWFDLKAR